MFSNTVSEAFAALEGAVEVLGAVDWEALPAGDLLAAIERLETGRRRTTALAHDLVAAVSRCDEKDLGGARHTVIADVIRVSTKESRRRLRDAAQVSSRTTLTGQRVAPELPATAKAWSAGVLDPEHLRVIQGFIRELPVDVSPLDAERAEAFLAEKAAELRPDQLQKLAEQLLLRLNPDGRFSDEDRARRRGFTWCGAQGPDGMSIARLTATPEMRALLEAWFAKFAAPGMCNPEDQTPTVTGEPAQEVIDRDARSCAQRQHDALGALVRGQLGDPKLGQHNGLPVTVVVSATLDQLQNAAGRAVTAGGSVLPMSDLIRMASHAYHYLCIFDQHSQRPLYLGRSKRVASADQRIVLHAKDRGCTAPGCTVPGYLCEVHHVEEWNTGGFTNIDNLTFACSPHHRLITPGGWTTRKHRDGTTQWLPPPNIRATGGTNTFHHPERFIS